MTTEEDDLLALGSQDDALFLQVYEAYESTARVKDDATKKGAGDGEDTPFIGGSEGQDKALYLACEEYEQSAASTAASDLPSLRSDQKFNSKTETREVHHPKHAENIIRNVTSKVTSSGSTSTCSSITTSIPSCTSITSSSTLSDQTYVQASFRFREAYLTVTNLVSQLWCEQQMVYSFGAPKDAVETPAMAAGTNIHMERGETLTVQCIWEKI